MTLRDSSCQDPSRSFHKSANLKRQLSLHHSDQITYSVTPPRQNSMESDRPTHIITDTQSQRQHCARSSPLLPTLICLLRQPFSAPCLLPTMNVCRLLRDLTATTLLFASVCLETEILAVTCSGSHSSGLSGEGIRGCHLHLDECVQCLDDYL
jgi:hypothetical protein